MRTESEPGFMRFVIVDSWIASGRVAHMKRLLRLPLLAAAGLLFAGLAAADTITSPADVESSTDLEAEIEALFGPYGPFWTTTANVAEIDYLLGIAADSAEGDASASELAIVLEEEN